MQIHKKEENVGGSYLPLKSMLFIYFGGGSGEGVENRL